MTVVGAGTGRAAVGWERWPGRVGPPVGAWRDGLGREVMTRGTLRMSPVLRSHGSLNNILGKGGCRSPLHSQYLPRPGTLPLVFGE